MGAWRPVDVLDDGDVGPAAHLKAGAMSAPERHDAQ